jgi:hypothetical protein
MAIDLSTLFGQQPDYSAFLPDAERKRMQTNANQAALLNSAIALLAQSGRTTQPVSTQQALAGALSEAQKGYQSSMDRGMQELLTGLKIRESIGGKSPELSKEQQQYAFQRYGKSKFIDLDKTQQLDVLEFGQTPDINKALEQHIAAQKLKADTGRSDDGTISFYLEEYLLNLGSNILTNLDENYCKYIVTKFLSKDEFIELERGGKHLDF